MVWFHCDDCGDTIKKPKLVSHYRNCSASGFSCVDCLQTFTRATVNSHTTCVTEHEKYALAATKPGGFAAGGLSANREGGPTAGVPSEPTGLEFLSTRPPWRCSVCNVNCTSRETLVNHAAGAKHKRRARAALAAANGCNKVPGSNANVANGGGVSTGAAGVGAPAVSAATAGKPRMSPSSSSSSSSSDGSSSSDDDEKAGNREPPVKRQASGGGATPAATAKGNGKLTKRSSSSSSSSDSDSDSDLPAAKKGKTEPAAKRPAPQPVLALSDSSSSSSSEDDSDSDDGPTKRVAVQKGGGAAGTTGKPAQGMSGSNAMAAGMSKRDGAGQQQRGLFGSEEGTGGGKKPQRPPSGSVDSSDSDSEESLDSDSDSEAMPRAREKSATIGVAEPVAAPPQKARAPCSKVRPCSSSEDSDSDSSNSNSNGGRPAGGKGQVGGKDVQAKAVAVAPIIVTATNGAKIKKRAAPEPEPSSTSGSDDSSSDDSSGSDDAKVKSKKLKTDNLDLSLQDAKKFARLTKAVREALERKAEVGRSVLLRLVHTHLLAGSEVEVTDVELQRVRQQLVAKGVCELVRDIRLTKPKKAAAKKVGK